MTANEPLSYWNGGPIPAKVMCQRSHLKLILRIFRAYRIRSLTFFIEGRFPFLSLRIISHPSSQPPRLIYSEFFPCALALRQRFLAAAAILALPAVLIFRFFFGTAAPLLAVVPRLFISARTSLALVS